MHWKSWLAFRPSAKTCQIAGEQGVSRARCEVWDAVWRFAAALLSVCCCLCWFSVAEFVQSEAWVDFCDFARGRDSSEYEYPFSRIRSQVERVQKKKEASQLLVVVVERQEASVASFPV